MGAKRRTRWEDLSEETRRLIEESLRRRGLDPNTMIQKKGDRKTWLEAFRFSKSTTFFLLFWLFYLVVLTLILLKV